MKSICCHPEYGEGSFTLKTRTGAVIAKGADFGSEHVTNFTVPFVAPPSMAPSVSHAPSTSRPPTMRPSVSHSPTETCFPVEITVMHDDGYPRDTSY